MFFMYTLMIILSTFIMFSSHPVSIMIVIMTQTLMVCLSAWILIESSWFSFIMFLIFLGGLMVLFIYIVSLAANEKFDFNVNTMSMIFILCLVTIFISMNKNLFNKEFHMNQDLNCLSSMILSSSIMITTMLIMSYLLFTLVVAVKTAMKFEGPLRNFIK